MKKRMFSKFTTILQQAVEALAPNISLQEDFVYHWKAITNYFIDNKDEKKPIEHTNIPGHLEQMLDILQEEESVCESGSTGPCMEYMLQHKLLETLYTLARTDFPPGMKQTVLVFFTKLLSRIKQPLLPHINVHKAVHRLVRICGEVKAGPAENEEIHFLCTVSSKITTDPYLVNFFIDTKKKVSHVQAQISGVVSPSSSKSEFSLINSLLALSQSADGRVAVKACEGLMLCSTLPEQLAASCLVHHTTFCQHITDRLCQLYKKLPKTANPTDLEGVQAKWGLDVITDLNDSHSFPGKRNVISFLSWLDYCDQLITVAHPTVGEALTKTIRNNFLDAVIEPALLQASESGLILSTCYLCRCLRTVCSPLLLSEMVRFLLSSETSQEVHVENMEEESKLRHRLIDRCNHLSEEVCIATLKLFDTLLQKEDSHILHNLVLRNLLGRGYFKSETTSESTAASESSHPDRVTRAEQVDTGDKIEDRSKISDSTTAEEQRSSKPSPQTETSAEPYPENETSSELSQETEMSTVQSQVSSSSFPSSPVSTPGSSIPGSPVKTEVHKVINSFLMLVPEEMKSCSQTTDGDYDVYLRDAHRQYSDMESVCRPWLWPTTPVTDVTYGTGSFTEGTFLKMLFDKLHKLINQPYAVNLQVTSVLSRLCLMPQPNLHELLLDPFLAVQDGVRTPYTIFQKVVGEMKSRVKTEADVKMKLVTVRQQLMGVESSVQSVEDSNLFETIILLEEFCKELAAIAFVKHHATITVL